MSVAGSGPGSPGRMSVAELANLSVCGSSTTLEYESQQEVLLPAGSFGAGGWAPGTKYAGKYPRLDADQCHKARKVFREMLIKRYHSVVRAWKDIDKNGDGRLSLYEFMRGCQKLGVHVHHGARRLWEALDMDRSGFVTLLEVDADLARRLGTLAVCIWAKCGSVNLAWTGLFNPQGKLRVVEEDFVKACKEIEFPDDAAAVFQALRTDKASNGLSREEFGFLELWFLDKKEPTSPLHPGLEPDRLRRSQTLPDPHEIRPVAKATYAPKDPKLAFKDLLRQSYGNMVRAWRMGLDRDHNGILDWKEFQRACADVGYAGNRRELWKALDADLSGGVSLREIDEASAHLLEALLRCVHQRYPTWEHAWHDLIDKRGDDRVDRVAFIQACGVLGYGGNADRLFELLDMDRVNYLSLATTSWIEEANRGDSKPEPTGMTMAAARLLDTKFRDQRMRRQRVLQRDRSEIGSPLVRSASFAGFGGLEGSHSGSPWSGKSRGKEEDRELLPDWLLSMEVDWSPGKSSTKSASSPGGTSRRQRAVQLSPRTPGQGGWPGNKLRLTDPVWGGSSPKAASRTATPSSPLSRTALSESNLTKWRTNLVPMEAPWRSAVEES